MNDPRITSYALGELEGQAREDFERELAASDDLQKQLEETIHLAEVLGTLRMPTEQLEPATRSALLDECAKNQARRRKGKILRFVVPIGLAAAASIVAVAVVTRLETPAPTTLADAKGQEIPAPASTPAPVAAPAMPAEPVALARADAKADVRAAQLAGVPLSVAAPAPAEVSAVAADTDALLALNKAPSISSGSKIKEFTAGWGKGEAAVRGARARQFAGEEGGFVCAPSAEFNTEAYSAIRENTFLDARQNPLSTFSIDVDTASYSNVRRFLRDGATPPAGAIRTEEMINYFAYDYPQPQGAAPFSVNLEAASAPWDAKRGLVRIGLKGRELPATERAPANLVFLVDVSGSMNEPNKLPLLQRSLRALVENLSAKDRVAIAVYAGSSGLVLPPTPGTKKQDILDALDRLSAGGTTHGSAGIKLAYETARKNFLEGGANRVILCTDGDFNVGVTDQSELQKLIERERASGVFLSVLGFGTGNVKDSTMELLADKGNGNYAYIDTINEGRKVLVEQMGATLFTIAKDVKIQVEFNPARVAGYRLIGYENRLLAKEDFNDDKKDAGEIGTGHAVTALYEIIPAGENVPGSPSVDPLKYQKPEPLASGTPVSGDLLTVKLRYKAPDGDKSQLLEVPLAAPEAFPAFAAASADFRFAAAVAAFGMKLRGSPDAGSISWDEILKIARGALGEDPGSYRAEFLTLVESAKKLAPGSR